MMQSITAQNNAWQRMKRQMNKCPVCKTGNLVKSGAHLYCDKCSFSQFVLTDDYMNACINLLAELVSNTKFPGPKEFGSALMYYIAMHLPQLDDWLATVVSGKNELLEQIYDSVVAAAINLQIGEETFNEQEARESLRCQCGCDDFELVKVGELHCRGCNAKYVYNHEEGIYEPYFLCECGQAAYTTLDDYLCQCVCGALYIHDETNHIFRRVTHG